MNTSEKTPPRNFREKAVAFFMKNLLMFAALLLTVLIWSAIRFQFRIEKTVEVDIGVEPQKGEIPLGSPTPEKVTVTLKGDKSRLETMTEKSVTILLKYEQAKRKDKSCVWALRSSDVKLPYYAIGIKVLSIKPDKVSQQVDKMDSKTLPVEAILDETTLPKGYKVGKVTVSPEKITVTAPSSKLEKIKTIRTLPISLENITHSFDCDQEFDTENCSDLDFDRKNVLVQVEILRALKTRTFNTLPVRILIPPSSKKQTLSCEIVSAPTVDLEVSGSENVIDLLRKEDIFVFANISDFTKPGLYWIDLRCAIDKNGITSSKIDPPKISVKLEQISKR